jgi:integrase
MSTSKASRGREPIPGEPNLFRKGDRVVLRKMFDAEVVVRSYRTLTAAKRDRDRLDAGIPLNSREGFCDYADHWIDNYLGRKGDGANEETRESYRKSLDQRAKPFFKHAPLERINGPWLKRYVRFLSAGDKRLGLAPLASASVRRHFAVVRALLNTAYEDGDLAHSPVAGFRVVVPGSTRQRKPKRLTPDETIALLAAIPAEHADVTYLMATGALRISEALNVRCEDLYQDASKRPMLYVRKSKSVAGESEIVLTPETWRMLVKRRNGLENNNGDAPLFPNATGGVYDRRNWTRRIFKPAANAAGVAWASPKALRHGVGSLMADHGYSAAQIAAQLRHADGGVLALRTYVHPEQPNVDFIDDVLAKRRRAKSGTRGPTRGPTRGETPRQPGIRKAHG